MPLTCKCGQAADRILEIGLTSEHELAVYFWCRECRTVVSVATPLADCWRECPEPEATPGRRRQSASETSVADAVFLHSMGIQSLEEGACSGVSLDAVPAIRC